MYIHSNVVESLICIIVSVTPTVAEGVFADVVKLQTMRCLFEAYEHVLSLLENVFTPMFCHSDEVRLFLYTLDPSGINFWHMTAVRGALDHFCPGATLSVLWLIIKFSFQLGEITILWDQRQTQLLYKFKCQIKTLFPTQTAIHTMTCCEMLLTAWVYIKQLIIIWLEYFTYTVL